MQIGDVITVPEDKMLGSEEFTATVISAWEHPEGFMVYECHAHDDPPDELTPVGADGKIIHGPF